MIRRAKSWSAGACLFLAIALPGCEAERPPLNERNCLQVEADRVYEFAGAARYRADLDRDRPAPLGDGPGLARLPRGSLNAGFHNGAHWVYFCLQAVESAEYNIQLNNPFLEDVQFLAFPAGQEGRAVAHDAGLYRRGPERVPALRLSLDAGESREVYVRIASRTPIRGVFDVSGQRLRGQTARAENYLFGLVFGLSVGAALWTLLFAFRARVAASSWLLLYFIAYVGYRNFFHGIPLLFSVDPTILANYQRLTLALAAASVLGLTRWQLQFLELETISAMAARIVQTLFWSAFALLLGALIEPYATNRIYYMWAMVAPFFAVAAAFLYWRGGGEHGALFALATTLTFGLTLYFVLAAAGFGAYRSWTGVAMELATLIQGGAFTVMMGDRMRRLQQDRQRELEREVSARTEALELEVNARLAAQSRAEEAVRARSRFLANMSHEIRTPMNSILGMVELLRDSPLNAEQQRYLQSLHDGGRALLRILNDVLDLSRIESGRIEIRTQTIDVRAFVRGLAAMHEVAMRDRGLLFEACFSDDCPAELETDPDRLGQILINLLNNALKFTEHGSVRLLAAPATDAVQGRIEFSVCDTGSGIAPDQLQRIFERFQQVAGERRGGAGLGLSISRDLAFLLGGELSAESNVGEGSCFRLRLPLRVALPPAVAIASPSPTLSAPAKKSTSAPSGATTLQGCAVLIVDDAADNRTLFLRFLEKAGASATAVSSASEALQLLRERSFDVVLMDIQMPEIDGFECLQRLRKFETELGREACPVIAVTAFAMGDEFERALRSDFVQVMSKPTPREGLVQAVRSAWKGGGDG